MSNSNGIHSSISLNVREISCLENTSLIEQKTISFIGFNLPVTERSRPADDTIELQCYLNTYQGHRQCFNRSFHIQWRTEHDTLLDGRRFCI